MGLEAPQSLSPEKYRRDKGVASPGLPQLYTTGSTGCKFLIEMVIYKREVSRPIKPKA